MEKMWWGRAPDTKWESLFCSRNLQRVQCSSLEWFGRDRQVTPTPIIQKLSNAMRCHREESPQPAGPEAKFTNHYQPNKASGQHSQNRAQPNYHKAKYITYWKDTQKKWSNLHAIWYTIENWEKQHRLNRNRPSQQIWLHREDRLCPLCPQRSRERAARTTQT